MQRIKRNWATLMLVAILIVILLAAIYFPLGRLIYESLQVDNQFSLIHFFRFFDIEHSANIEALLGSISISVLTVLCSLLVGLPMAILFSRFQFPGRSLMGVLVTLPLLLPPMVGVLAFYFLMGESGILPRVLQKIFSLSFAPFVMSGVPAILLVHTYSFYPFFYLFARNAFSCTDGSLEEAAQGLGAGRWKIWYKVIFPQIKPAIVGASLLVFMNSMASFTAPYLFGGNWRFLSLEIYRAKLNGDFAMAVTQSVILVGISTIFITLIRLYDKGFPTGLGRKGVTIKTRRDTTVWQKIFLITVGTFIIILLTLPQMTLFLIAFVKNGTWTWQILPDTFTIENFKSLFTSARIAKPLTNSLWMSAIATGAGTIVAILAAYLVSYKKNFSTISGFIDSSIMLPWAVPGTVIAIALIVGFNESYWFTGNSILVGTITILPLAYFIRHLPIQFRAMMAAFAQIDSSLDEAAKGLGAGLWLRLKKITLPLIFPGIITGAMVAFVIAVGEFVSSILLYTHSNRPLSIAIFSELRMFNLGTTAAYAVLLTVLISFVMWIAQRKAGKQRISL